MFNILLGVKKAKILYLGVPSVKFTMKLRAIFLSILLSCCLLEVANAQQSENSSCACCTAQHNEFDFWIGEWTVYDVNGKIVGTNTITKAYDNCVLREQWKSTNVNRGTSYNYYDAKEKTWNQLWIDNSGFNLTLIGNYINGKMVLKSKLLEGKKGKYYNQITWQPNEDKSVTQIWELFSKEGKLLQEVFRGIYKKTVK